MFSVLGSFENLLVLACSSSFQPPCTSWQASPSCFLPLSSFSMWKNWVSLSWLSFHVNLPDNCATDFNSYLNVFRALHCLDKRRVRGVLQAGALRDKSAGTIMSACDAAFKFQIQINLECIQYKTLKKTKWKDMKTEEDMKDGLQRASEDTLGSRVDNVDFISANFWVQSWMSYMSGILLWGGVRSSKYYCPQTERADCLKVVHQKACHSLLWP